MGIPFYKAMLRLESGKMKRLSIAALFMVWIPLCGAEDGPDSLRKEIEGLRVKEVAWRKIPWKTCLLDAVRASKEEKKPIVVWCFIDRPIDDKRC